MDIWSAIAFKRFIRRMRGGGFNIFGIGGGNIAFNANEPDQLLADEFKQAMDHSELDGQLTEFLCDYYSRQVGAIGARPYSRHGIQLPILTTDNWLGRITDHPEGFKVELALWAAAGSVDSSLS